MSRYWQKTFQETVGKTVTGLSDSAARFKTGWADKPQASPEPSSPASSPRTSQPSPEKDKGQQQYLRLPLESARKLRWYDRDELNSLVESNLKDKLLLQSTVSALRQIIQESGVAENDLEEDLRERLEDVERLAFFDDGVSSVLLASAQAEVGRLKALATTQAAQVEELQQRIASGESVTTSSHVPEQPVIIRVTVRESPELAQEHYKLISHRPTPSTFESIKEEDSLADGEIGGTHRPYADVHVSAESLPVSRQSRDGEGAEQSSGLPLAMDVATSQLLGKLRRVEEERREYFEEMARLNDLLRSHEIAAQELRAQAEQLQAEVEAGRRARTELEESAEARVQEIRSRAAVSQGQHAEMVRRAQDICIEAEERATALERRLEKAEGRAVKAEAELREAAAEARSFGADLKAKEKERVRLEAKAATAEGLLSDMRQKSEIEKGGALASALSSARKAAEEREAELRNTMREAEAGLQARIERLEAENAEFRRMSAKADMELSELERRHADADEATSSLANELRAAEASLADRDALEAKAAALEERLEETRAVQSQLANYKQIAKELESERARVEEEVVATVRIATSLETRLQAANGARTAAEHAAALAAKQAREAEERVDGEVVRRLSLAGGNEEMWPREAREAVSRQAAKLEAVHHMCERLQNELDSEHHALASEQASTKLLQNKLSTAEEKLSRSDREAREAIQRLERKVSMVKSEANDWRRETAAAEAELSRVSSSHRRPQLAQRTSSAGSHASTPRRGGGALKGIGEEALANGNAAGPIDHLYLKNVLLKFIVAVTEGRREQCQVLLPAVATLLQASPGEFKSLKGLIAGNSSWWQ